MHGSESPCGVELRSCLEEMNGKKAVDAMGKLNDERVKSRIRMVKGCGTDFPKLAKRKDRSIGDDRKSGLL